MYSQSLVVECTPAQCAYLLMVDLSFNLFS
uniref:Uncharacterized protein n=1 Tax=Arundo donax TaxID=35708 RepID=A0A0A9ETG4_ARUDO